jgi:cell division protein FtsQ
MMRWAVVISLVLAMAGGVVFIWREAFRPGSFPIREVRMHGIVNTTEEAVMRALRIPEQANLLTINPKQLHDQILAELPWVRRVLVERILPDILVIKVEERVPVCLARVGDVLWLMDEYGKPIKALNPQDPYLFPVVSMQEGELKPEMVVRIVNMLGRQGWLRSHVAEVVVLPGERWALHTVRGIRVLLSPSFESELLLLKRLHRRYRVLDRQIRQIDLRVQGLVAMRPVASSGAGVM